MAYKDSKDYVKSVAAFNGRSSIQSNAPASYSDQKRQYMKERASMFDASRAYLSNDYVEAEIQGVTENFYEWVTTSIRLADIANKTASSANRVDDYKEILIPELGIDYFPIGAKVKTMGSTWICVNPANISSSKATAVVARCNASYNSYDYYGNVVTEPIIVEKYSMAGNDNDRKQNIVLMDGYFNITCQLNGNTEQLKENSRIILGKKPYQITGVTDFIQEFTGDRESCRLLTFTARVEEPTESDDITENFIAGGNEIDFDCIMQGVDNMTVGEQTPFIPHFVKNDEVVESTDENPITWIWESSNKNVATVDDKGNVTAVSLGNAEITARMAQNNAIFVSAELAVVADKPIENKVVFKGLVPERISQYESVTISACYIENSLGTNKALTWEFSGANENDYSVKILKGKKSAEIYCISPSDERLNVTARYGEYSQTATIELVGY